MRRADTVGLAILLALLGSACTDGGTVEEPLAPAFAKPGSGDPIISSVEPSSAPQDTTLDVAVSGSDFDSGSAVTLTLAGVASGEVVTNRTTYVNSRKLIANITITADAEVALYDVEVRTLGGKKGVATEIFEILARGNVDTDPRAVWEISGTLLDGTSSGLLGDGRDADGNPSTTGVSEYRGDRCGVNAKIFATDWGSGSGDAVLQPVEVPLTGQLCGAERTLRARLSGGTVRSIEFMNMKCLMQLVPGWSGAACPHPDTSVDPNDPTVGYYPIGADVPDRACGRLRWNPEVAGGAASGNVRVTYLGTTGPNGTRQWRAETQPPHAAGCYTWRKGDYVWNGVTHTVPFRIVITEIPYPGA
jgi:hypothetical protein